LNLYEKVFYFIAGHGRGWSFSSSDLIHKFTRQEIDNTLSDLVEKDKIRRVSRGIYDYPKYSELLKTNLSPDIEQVAHAYARKFNWQIEVSGDTALNILGLSTQIVGNYIYLSNGPSKKYEILNKINIQFKKSALKNIGFKYKESSLIVQALKTLGKENITNETILKIQKQIDEKMYDKILKDTKTSTDWIYEIIKEICTKKSDNE
jgi:Mor family transcriptional regulator